MISIDQAISCCRLLSLIELAYMYLLAILNLHIKIGMLHKLLRSKTSKNQQNQLNLNFTGDNVND